MERIVAFQQCRDIRTQQRRQEIHRGDLERETQHEGDSRRHHRTLFPHRMQLHLKTIQLSGAGSTFVYPVMGRWISGLHKAHPNVQINYQSIGSGGGIQQVKSGTVDFGASDAALTDQQLARDEARHADAGVRRPRLHHL